MNEEQKRREMQIEEIANIPHKCIKSSCEGCIKNDRKCAYYKQAEALYDAGYRKADEVRKETAEKILDEVKDMFLNTSYNIDWIFNKLEELAKQFGVEIKE